MNDISYILNNVLKPISKDKTKFIILRYWKQIIGDKYYKYCKPSRTYYNKKEDAYTITIVVNNSSLATYISASELYIIENIKLYTGFDKINKIKIKQDIIEIEEAEIYDRDLSPENNERKKCVNKLIDNIENENLKNSLYKLGMNIS